MRPKVPTRISELLAKFGALISFTSALAILAFVIVSYIERDVLRMRGVVLSFILLGLAMIVWTEAGSALPISRHHSR
jgi:lipopolysaccharide export LptBFGC system permease protein LptF